MRTDEVTVFEPHRFKCPVGRVDNAVWGARPHAGKSGDDAQQVGLFLDPLTEPTRQLRPLSAVGPSWQPVRDITVAHNDPRIIEELHFAIDAVAAQIHEAT